ncbi:MAG: multiprotein bridging factor aMBF1 [Candidatus Aenigmatarchaeota archaeon]
MECELCGKETNKIFVVEIEGAILEVCENCAKNGRIISIKNKKIFEKREREKDIEDELELIENYGEVIRNTREKLKISIQELAKRIGEKENLLRKIENEEIIPSDRIIEKLEKFLKIKLREKVEYKISKKEEKKESLRIADIVEIK